MCLANTRGLTHDGLLVRVAGARNEFALAFVQLPRSSEWCVLGEYQWDIIERAALGDGRLK